jgi:acyl carrier protein
VKSITHAEVMAMLAESFNEPIENLAPDVLRERIPGWDSMGALMLIAELDDRFSLELTAEVSKAMQRVSDVLDFLREQGVAVE